MSLHISVRYSDRLQGNLINKKGFWDWGEHGELTMNYPSKCQRKNIYHVRMFLGLMDDPWFPYESYISCLQTWGLRGNHFLSLRPNLEAQSNLGCCCLSVYLISAQVVVLKLWFSLLVIWVASSDTCDACGLAGFTDYYPKQLVNPDR